MLNHILNQLLAVGGRLYLAKRHLRNGYCGSGLKQIDEAIAVFEQLIAELKQRLEDNASEIDRWQDL